MSQDFDLNLPSLWFTHTPPSFPVPSMASLGPCTSTYTWWHTPSPAQTTLTISSRWTRTLAITKLHLTWQPHAPLRTVVAIQKHLPAPLPLSAPELLKAHRAYGENVAAWAEKALDTSVGDGQCWTLVHDALTDLARAYRDHGLEPPLVSQGRTHGQLILSLDASAPGSLTGLLSLADVRRGDILELEKAHFRTREEEYPLMNATASESSSSSSSAGRAQGGWRLGSRERNVRLGQHTVLLSGWRRGIRSGLLNRMGMGRVG